MAWASAQFEMCFDYKGRFLCVNAFVVTSINFSKINPFINLLATGSRYELIKPEYESIEMD